MDQKTTGHKDCAGREIFEGDKVATNHEGYTCSLAVVVVIAATPKKVKLALRTKPAPKGATYASNPEAYETFLKFPEQTCLIR